MNMGNFISVAERRNKAEEHKNSVREIIGKYFLDLSKLFLTTVAIAALSPLILGNTGPVNWLIALVGVAVSVVFALFGYRTLKQK